MKEIDRMPGGTMIAPMHQHRIAQFLWHMSVLFTLLPVSKASKMETMLTGGPRVYREGDL